MKEIDIYTDGACSGNPGPGGWGTILIFNGVEKEMSGFEKNTTNNRMEILAAIQGLKALKEPCIVNLYSDSQYLCGAINENWLYAWQNKKWKTSNKSDVKNVDLWKELITLLNIHKVTFHKVKGHSTNVNNNRCDALATGEIAKNSK